MDQFMMKLNGCCCCFNLRTGTLILLWSGLVFSVLSLIEKGASFVSQSNDPRIEPVVKTILALIFYYYFAHLVIMNIIPCALGLYGIYERRPGYLKPYIYLGVFELVGLIVLAVVVLLAGVFSGPTLAAIIQESMKQPGKNADGVGAAVGVIVFFTLFAIGISGFICWYFTSVIYRYYRQLDNEVKPYHGGEYNAPPRYEAQMKA